VILRKILRIVATRCQVFRLICTKFDFGAVGAYSAPPELLVGLRVLLLRGGREGEGKKGKGEKGKEKLVPPLFE